MQLRISLTVSGAVALGAYEGGALAALLHAVRPLVGGANAPVRVDAIGAASAGSITGLLAARTLLEGYDPVAVLRAAWVDNGGISELRAHNTKAPLNIERLREQATTLLDPAGARSKKRQTTPVHLSFVLAALRGLEYTIPALNAPRPIRASTYVDQYELELRPKTPVAQLLAPKGSSVVDAVPASSANALGFPPYLIDRKPERQRVPDPYSAVANWPASGEFWYTDGATVNNEPLGRTFDLTNPLDSGPGDFGRLQLLIHPHPTGAPTDSEWADPQRQPTWLETLRRAAAVLTTQSLFADLKQVEKTNSRIAWAEELVQTLAAALDRLPQVEQKQVGEEVAHLVARLRGQQDALHSRSTRAVEAGPGPRPEGMPLRDMLREAVGITANVRGRTKAVVDVISPLVLPESSTMPVEKMLSGEFFLHFGGFLDSDLRQADFDLGYSSTVQWLTDGGLNGPGLLDDQSAAKALQSATQAYTPSQTWREYGQKTFGSLSVMDKAQALLLVTQVSGVIARDLIAGDTQS